MEWAFRAARDKGLTPSATLVLIALAHNASGKHGRAWAGREYLAGETGLSERTVQRAVGDLERAQVVPVERYPGRGILWQFPAAPARQGRQEGSHRVSGGETQGESTDAQRGDTVSHKQGLTREQGEARAYRSANPIITALSDRAMAHYSQAEIQLTMEV